MIATLPTPSLTATIKDGIVVVHEGFGWRRRIGEIRRDGKRSHCTTCGKSGHNARRCTEGG